MTPLMEEQLIWFPDDRIYSPRGMEYSKLVTDATLDEIVDLVRKRAEEDGQYCIDHHLVGGHDDKMRRWMAFVSERKNIQQCTAHIYRESMENERTIDWVCRDLANASKVMVR
jgi:hypothetical protein